MNNEIEYSGYWWLPSKTDDRIPGRLRFSLEHGVSLELFGKFDHISLQDPRGVNILGESVFGDSITIYQAFIQSRQSTALNPSGGISYFNANKVFIGAHFNHLEDAKFIKISFTPTYLDKWLNLSIMDYEHNEKGFDLSYVRPEIINFQLSNELNVSIEFETFGPSIGSNVTSIEFSHKARVSISFLEESHFNNFSGLITHFLNFLSIAVIAPVFPIVLEGWILDTKTEQGKDRHQKKITILQPLYTSPQEEQFSLYYMLFTYDQIIDRFGQFLKNWFEKQKNLKPIFDLYFGVLYNKNSFPVTTFLNYVQAIETYHIRTISDDVDPPGVYQSRVKRILESVPSEYHDWLGSILNFANRPTLAQRMKEIITLYPFPVSSQAGDREAFIKKVKDSRNYYTHYDPSLENKAQQGGYLKGMIMTLGTLLEGLLLHEIGFEFDEVENLQKNRRRLPQVWY